MNESALLALPVLLLGGLLWLAGLVASRWRPLRCRWPGLTAEWTALGLLAALTLGFFWRVLLTRDTWLPRGGGDFNSFYYPLYSFAARRIQEGDFPLWNPHLWGGMPFAADQQTGLFSPFNLAAFLLARPFAYGTLEWLAIGQVWLASVLAYALCRELGCRRGPALIGGATFAYSGFMVAHLGHYPMIAVAAWLPAALLALRRALLGRGNRLWWTLATAGAVLLALLGGHQQIFLYLLTALVLYGLFLLWWSSPPASWPAPLSMARVASWLGGDFAAHWVRGAGQLALALGTAAGLAAPALLPSLELASHSIRAGLSYPESAAYALRPLHLVTLLLPNALGSTPTTFMSALDVSGEVWGYAGAVALGLALVALLAPLGPRRPEARFFGGLGLLALLVALGPATPLHGWFYAFAPGYSRVRASGRLLVLVDLALALLAALGADGLLRLVAAGPRDLLDRGLRRASILLGGLLGLGLLVLLSGYSTLLAPKDPPAPLAQYLDSLAACLFLLALLLAFVVALRRGHLGVRAASALLGALVVFDLFGATAPIPPTSDNPLTSFRHEEALATLRAQVRPGDPYRIDHTSLGSGWQPSWAATVGLDTVAGTYDPLGVATYNRYWNDLVKQRDSPRYDLLNARYTLTTADRPPSGAKFRELARGGDYVLYENTAALPRAYLVGRAVPVSDGDAAWAAITAPDFDPRATAYVQGTTTPLDNGAPYQPVAIASYEPDRITLTVESDREALLVLSEVAYPGWRALVDGQETPILTADYTFRALRVPAGRHDVRLDFAPPLWRAGWLLAGLTAFAVVVLLVAERLRHRRRAATN